MFAVVEFLNPEEEPTGEVSIVPLIWLHKSEKKCHWPIGTNKMPFKEFVEKQTPPKKSWPLYRIKVKCKTGKLIIKRVNIYHSVKTLNYV